MIARLSKIIPLGMLVLFSTLAVCLPTRRALVIGNDTYPGNGLQNARNDAKAIAEALTLLGYASTLVLDADQRTMTATVDKFSLSLMPSDVAIVYYAGHGLQVDGENYLVPVDFHISDETDVKYQGYALSTLLGKLTEHGATTQIVILDACRDNPFLRSRSVRGGWASVGSSAGSFLAFGTSPGSTASDDPSEGHGLFTKALLKFLPAQLDVEQMFQRVRQDVIQKSNGRQVPWTASSLVGSFHFDPRGDANAPVLQTIVSSPDRMTQMPGPRSMSQTVNSRRMETQEQMDADQESLLLANALTAVRGLHFDKAITGLQSVLSIDPRCSLALRLLGVIFHLVGRNVEATQTLDRAILANPDDALSYSYRCLLTVPEHPDSSKSDCQAAISIRDDLPQSHLGLALDYASDGQTAKAYSEATKAIALNSTSSLGFIIRGDIATAENHQGLAQQDYARATKIALDEAR